MDEEKDGYADEEAEAEEEEEWEEEEEEGVEEEEEEEEGETSRKTIEVDCVRRQRVQRGLAPELIGPPGGANTLGSRHRSAVYPTRSLPSSSWPRSPRAAHPLHA